VKTVYRLLAFLYGFWGLMLLSVFLGMATTASAIGLLGTSAYLIARAALHPSIAVLQVAIVGVRFFGIVRGAFRYLERLVSHDVNFRLLSQLRVFVYRGWERLAPADASSSHSGDVLSKLVADIETLENFYLRAIAPPLVAVVASTGVCIFVGLYDAAFAWIVGGGLLVSGLVIPWAAYQISLRVGREWIQNRAGLFRNLVEGIQGMGDLLVFEGKDAHRGATHQLARAIQKSQMRFSLATGAVNALSVLFPGLTLLALMVVAIPAVNRGMLDGVSLAVLTLVVLASFEVITPLGSAAQFLESSLEAGQRIFSIAEKQPADTNSTPLIALPLTTDILVQGLSFGYSSTDEFVLKNIRFELPAGKRLGIVGPSGAGKTTILNLLLRFWDYETGSILLGGQELRSLDPEAVRCLMGVILQDNYLFNGTVRQNLTLAKPKAADDELLSMLNMVGLEGWLRTLPAGLDTWIGERGIQMSGGERQRLALARLILLDAPIWLLDEPTEHLDVATARDLTGLLVKASQGRSVIWVTHRLLGLDFLDEILVLKQGEIIERGTDAALRALNGLYARMWRLQRRMLI
jgi:ATP-binding cassette subfamily C protein CydC